MRATFSKKRERFYGHAGELAEHLSLTTVNESMSVADALRFRVEKGVRNPVILRQDGPYVINDRQIPEFLLDYEARKLVKEKVFPRLIVYPLIVYPYCMRASAEAGP